MNWNFQIKHSKRSNRNANTLRVARPWAVRTQPLLAMCAQPMRSSHSCCCPIASLRTHWCSLRAPALIARELSLAVRARDIARWAREPSLAGRATSLAVRASNAGRSARGTRACARCARGCAHLCEAARVVAQLACCPHATALARPSPMPIRSLLVAHDTRQGCCLALVHYALAHCIRAARATSSLARRRMPALYNTP